MPVKDRPKGKLHKTIVAEAHAIDARPGQASHSTNEASGVCDHSIRRIWLLIRKHPKPCNRAA